MTNPNALAAKIALLTATDAVFVGAARVISRAGTPAPVDAILAEIDTIVLERSLVLDIDGVTLRLAVAGRRLRGVLDVNGAPHALTGKVLSSDDTDTLRSVGALLADLCRDAGQITVTNQSAEPFATPAEVGVTATALADLWQGTPPATPQTPMGHFLAAHPELITGFLYVQDDTLMQTKGDTSGLDHIWRDQFAKFRDQQPKALGAQNGPVLIWLDTALGDGHAAGLAVIGQETAIFSYPTKQLNRVLAAWRQITS